MNQTVAVRDLYVEEAVSDLPEDLDESSFAITDEGIFEFDPSVDGWQPIQYGSETAPIPSVTARTATVGTAPTGRPLISNGNHTVYVDPDSGDDSASGTEDEPLATIQGAVQRAPIYLRDQYVIDLASVPDTPVTYDEDVLVPTIIATGQAEREVDASSPGPFTNLVLRGNRDDPGAVRIGSLTFGNPIGTSAGNLYGAMILRDNPYDDEGYGVAAYGNGEVKLLDVAFSDGPTNGVLAYGARMKARELNFGQGNLEIGLKAKRHASVVAHNPGGAVSRDGFRATANSTISIVKDRSVSGNPLFNTLRGGLIYDEISDSWVGLSGNASASGQIGEETSSRQVSMYSGTSANRSPGDIWYEDGSGDLEEGFYGQTEGGAKRLD